jgi:hypothetical protein
MWDQEQQPRPDKGSPDRATSRAAQTELVKLQRRISETELKVLVIFEGRDASGKDAMVKRIDVLLELPREARSFPILASRQGAFKQNGIILRLPKAAIANRMQVLAQDEGPIINIATEAGPTAQDPLKPPASTKPF